MEQMSTQGRKKTPDISKTNENDLHPESNKKNWRRKLLLEMQKQQTKLQGASRIKKT